MFVCLCDLSVCEHISEITFPNSNFLCMLLVSMGGGIAILYVLMDDIIFLYYGLDFGMSLPQQHHQCITHELT